MVVVRKGCVLLESKKVKILILVADFDGIFVESLILMWFLKFAEKVKIFIMSICKEVL